MSQKSRKCMLLSVLLLLLFFVGKKQVAAEEFEKNEINQSKEEPEWEVAQPLEQLSLYATSAILLDAASGRVLYEKNGFSKMAMASTTKIMTCIVALESCDLNEEVSVSAYAASMPKVKMYVKKGETYRLKDLLYSLMLESHNDSAVAIAEHIGKKLLSNELKEKNCGQYTVEESKQAVAAFAWMMNQKARKIGCEDTWFITPNGLDATQTLTQEDGTQIRKEHSTTARDLAVIMAYCIQDSPQKEAFLEITRTPSYYFLANDRSFSCINHNSFLTMMEGVLSGKTGFTNKSGYCYVGALQRGNCTFVVALLACGWPDHKSYKWSDTRTLMEYGLAHYEYHSYKELVVDRERLLPVIVHEGCTERLGATAYVEVTLREKEGIQEADDDGLMLREDERYQLRYSLPDSLEAPVSAGEQVGEVAYLLGEKVLKTIPVVTKSGVDKIDFGWCVMQVIERFFLKKAIWASQVAFSMV